MIFGIFPLSLYKEVSALRYVCMAGVGVTFYISIIIFLEPFIGSINGYTFSDNIKETEWWKTIGILKTFPFAIFSFFCQTNSQDIFYELKNPTRARMESVIKKSHYFAIFAYTLVGAFGYITFAIDTK